MRASPWCLGLVVSAWLTAPAFGAPNACDALAASPYDRARPAGVAGVIFEEMDAANAVAACAVAHRDMPDDPHITYQLARALEAANRDQRLAMRLFREAAAAGHILALTNIASMYLKAQGVEQNLPLAIGWFRKAADRGEPFAQMRLGDFYWTGIGVPKDLAAGYGWYQKAAAQGQRDAIKALKDIQELVLDGMMPEIQLAGMERPATPPDPNRAAVAQRPRRGTRSAAAATTAGRL